MTPSDMIKEVGRRRKFRDAMLEEGFLCPNLGEDTCDAPFHTCCLELWVLDPVKLFRFVSASALAATALPCVLFVHWDVAGTAMLAHEQLLLAAILLQICGFYSAVCFWRGRIHIARDERTADSSDNGLARLIALHRVRAISRLPFVALPITIFITSKLTTMATETLQPDPLHTHMFRLGAIHGFLLLLVDGFDSLTSLAHIAKRTPTLPAMSRALWT